MNTIKRLKNPVQTYAWGSRRAIAELLGEPSPSQTPQAELWMGAHPKSPSRIFHENRWISLSELIQKDPETILGKAVSERFNRRLPYLFKVLAAAHPLSIQSHPDSDQAREGFKRENRQDIPLNASRRNYRDDNAKPELICALSPFWALCGFRRIPKILSLFEVVCPRSAPVVCRELYRQSNTAGLTRFFRSLMDLDKATKRLAIREALSHAARAGGKQAIPKWITRLHAGYPEDVGVLAPLFLNLLCLRPGEAMFIDTGEPHAYLEGTGLELMANSDNVLRCGLTPKHVEIPELVKVLTYRPKPVDILALPEAEGCERIYPLRADEFSLSVITLINGDRYISKEARSPEILLCTQGEALIRDKVRDRGTHKGLVLARGASAFIPAAVSAYEVTGNAVLYKAAVPV